MATVTRKKRNLTGATDPVKGGSKAKPKAAAKPAGRKPKAAAAPKPATGAKRGPKPKAAAAPKAGRKPKAVHPEDRKMDNARAKHLRDQKAKGKTKSLEARLKDRLKIYSAGLKKAKVSQAKIRKLMGARQKVARQNLGAKQAAAKANLLARQKARMSQRLARKPVIKAGKIVTPKAKAVKVKIIKPTLKPLPHMKDGAITTAKRTPHKGTAAQKQGAKKAARTKKKGSVEV